MKRIFLAVAVSLAAVSLAVFSTRAVWSDTVSVTANMVTTGTADLQVRSTPITSQSDHAGFNSSTAVSAFNITDLVPGASRSGYGFSLWNNGGPYIDFNITGKAVSATSSPTLLDLSKVQLAVYEATASAGSGPATSGWINLTDWVANEKAISFLQATGSANYNIAVRLSNTVDNSWQGQSVTFGLVLTGTQPASGSF